MNRETEREFVKRLKVFQKAEERIWESRKIIKWMLMRMKERRGNVHGQLQYMDEH